MVQSSKQIDDAKNRYKSWVSLSSTPWSPSSSQYAGPPHASVTMSSPASTRCLPTNKPTNWPTNQPTNHQHWKWRGFSTALVPRPAWTWATWRTPPCFIATPAVGQTDVISPSKTPGFSCWHALTFMQWKQTHSTLCFNSFCILWKSFWHIKHMSSCMTYDMDCTQGEACHKFFLLSLLVHPSTSLPPLPQCRTEWFEFPTTAGPKLLFVSDCLDETFISTL